MARRKAPKTPGPFIIRAELLREKASDRDAYPFSLPVIRNLDRLDLHPKVTFLVGENGSGKSTLLEGIAVAYGLNPEGGSANFRFTTRDSHSQLHEALRLIKTFSRASDSFFLRAESFFNLATELERLDEGGMGGPLIDAYGGVSLHEQSHGESFLALFRNRFGECGLYLLDEPEAALSPQRQLSFLVLLNEYCKGGSQFLIATHSPIILAYPDAWIYQCGDDGLKRVRYEDTETYQVTHGFLSQPQRYLKVLLASDVSRSGESE